MTAFNRLLAGVIDLLLAPAAAFPPLVGVALVSLATAVVMLLAIRKTSNQRQLALVKRAIQAGFFELRLFADDVPAIFRTEREMLRDTLTYMRLSLIPVLWIIIPLTLLIVHLDAYFGHSGLATGTPALITATLRDDAEIGMTARTGNAALPAVDAASLEAPSSIQVETPAVWFPAANEVVWRITPRLPGEYVVRVRLGHEVFEKTLAVSEAVIRRSPVRLTGSIVDQLLNPSEAPLPDDGRLTAIRIAYPRRELRVLGWTASWLVLYLLLTFGFMLVLRRPLGVIL